VVVEQTHKKLEHWEAAGRRGSATRVIIDAVKEVGGPSFFSLLVIAVSFMPIFALQAQEGRLFKPLAFTKNFSMAIAAVLAITLDPALRLLFMRTRDLSFRPRWLSRPLNAVLVGSILYMPITLPGISVTEAGKYLQIQDKLIKQFPEVHSVFGKAGKAETATDPAPLNMVETTVVLKPETEWRKVRQTRWYSDWAPEFLKDPLRRI